MDRKKAAEYMLKDTFKITGRGLVFTGEIISGEINVGDFIEFRTEEKSLLRKILGIDMVSRTRTNLTGLLIKCESGEELENLGNWKPENVHAIVWSARNLDD